MSIPVLYTPGEDVVASSKMFKFMMHVQAQHPHVTDWPSLHAWSIQHPCDFWLMCATFCGFKWHTPPKQTLRRLPHPPYGRFFEDGRCNFAEMCLSGADDAVVLIETDEAGIAHRFTRGDIKHRVMQAIAQFKSMQIGQHDVVARILPN